VSIEAIQQVTQAETSAQEKKLAAYAQAKQIIRDAERAGQLLLEQTRQKAEIETREAMAQAEKNAATRAEQVISDNAKACSLLCSAAEARLDAAATLIVKRIVNV
jgi:V/A-type H+-transporting ATPase subunit G/H